MHPILQFLSQVFGGNKPQNLNTKGATPGRTETGATPPAMVDGPNGPESYAQSIGRKSYNPGITLPAGGTPTTPATGMMVPHILNMMHSYDALNAMVGKARLPEVQARGQLQVGTANSAPVANWQQAGFQPPTSLPRGAVDTIPVRGTNLQAGGYQTYDPSGGPQQFQVAQGGVQGSSPQLQSRRPSNPNLGIQQ